MPSRNLTRRLERLEAELAPPSDKPALTILVTSPGKPVTLGSRFGDWHVCWWGGCSRHELDYLVMVVKIEPYNNVR